jgi:hypothetical protein
MPDGKRRRRTADRIRQRWYAYWRSVRFTRRYGMGNSLESDGVADDDGPFTQWY